MAPHNSTDVFSPSPLVTAIVLCYNHARFVTQTLESVQNQSYRNLELIVIDDLSKDDSVAVIREWLKRTNSPGRFLVHTENRGICRSLNEALQHARGEYIAIIAADDVWLPDKTEQQVAALEEAPPAVGVIYSDAYQMDEGSNLLPEMFIESHRNLLPPPAGRINEILWAGNFIPAMTTLVRRKCYDDVGGYDESLVFEDWDMWLRISERYEFAYLARPSAYYRIVHTSMMRSKMHLLVDSRARIYLKGLQRGKLHGAIREEAIEDVCLRAKMLYVAGDIRSQEYLRAALSFRVTFGLIGMFILNSFRVPGPLVSKAVRRFKHFFGGLFPAHNANIG